MPEQVKLKRRHIKDDKFADFMLLARHQVTENWQMIVIGVVAAGLLVAGMFWFNNSQKAKQTEAASILARGLMEFRSGSVQNAIASLNQVITDNDNSDAVQQAVFTLGYINLTQRNYGDAIKYFEQYSREYRSDKLHLAAAYAGIGQSMENQSQFAEAAAKYVEAIKVDTAGALVDDYSLAAMRNYLDAGNTAAAKEQYDLIVARFPGTEIEYRAKLIYAEKVKG
jgi:outer membrane protein assembly factor BamD (BamD/ComL family)